MRQILCVCMLVVIAAFVLGCNEAPFSPKNDAITGNWRGIVVYGHPGPADEPLVDTVEVFFTFEPSRFFYSGGVSRKPGDPPMLMPALLFEADYVIAGNNMFVTAYQLPIVNHPLYLDGKFSLELTETSLRMYQVYHPQIWPEYHEVVLQRVVDKSE